MPAPPTLPTYPNLSGRVAFITGIGQTPVTGIDSSSVWGNGAAIAYLLAHNDVKLFGCDLNLESAQHTGSRIKSLYPNATINLATADVTKLDSIQAAVNACLKRHGRIDILINNVGMTRAGDAVTMAEEVWDKQIDLNLKSVFLTCKVVLPILEKQGGVVINNASITAIRYIGKPQVGYAASKAAVVQFTKHTACMWAKKGVRVNCVIPGLIRTPLVEGLRVSNDAGDNAAYESIVGAKIPTGELGDAFDVANAVTFLCSDAARYINGHELIVDGGMSAEAG